MTTKKSTLVVFSNDTHLMDELRLERRRDKTEQNGEENTENELRTGMSREKEGRKGSGRKNVY